ncbi:MAG: hypothetical protein JJU28_14600 [Cyclobacteriaceae bacterium]|nr:hypothetical protein [Cyclobacteriaceae bacterium]
MRLIVKNQTTIKTKTILLYTGIGLTLTAIAAGIIMFFGNIFKSSDAEANTLEFTTISAGNWTNNAIWSGGTAPNFDNWNPATEKNVQIEHNVTLTGGDINFNGWYHAVAVRQGAALTATVTMLTIENSNPPFITHFDIIDGELIINGNLTLTNGGRLYIRSNGKVTINGNLNLGGSGGRIEIEEGGELIVNGDSQVSGSNSVIQNAGTFTTTNLNITGGSTNNVGTSGRLIVNNNLTVGGSGTFNQTEGYAQVGGNFNLNGSSEATINGFLNVTGNINNNSTITSSSTGIIAWGGTWNAGGGSRTPFTSNGSAPASNPFDLATGTTATLSKCVAATGDDQNEYGNGKWIGYVYDGTSLNTTLYEGKLPASFFSTSNPVNFDINFGGAGDATTFNTQAGCAVERSTFSVRFRMRYDFGAECKPYNITVGGDDGFRLYIDGVLIPELSSWATQSYITRSMPIALQGIKEFVLEYYENTGDNRVSFNIQNADNSVIPGSISGTQFVCGGDLTPSRLNNQSAAFSCNSNINYFWQYRNNCSGSWINISNSNNAFYDIPAASFSGQRCYRRAATDGISTSFSNAVTVQIYDNSANASTWGDDEWIGHVYQVHYTSNLHTRNLFNSSYYRGTITQSDEFNQTFCGSTCWFNTSDCPVYSDYFAVRYRMRKDLPAGEYTFTIGGDDGVRLSVNGGNSWLISDWSNHAYRESSNPNLYQHPGGVIEFVLEYYEASGGNRVSFSYIIVNFLPIELIQFTASSRESGVLLEWSTASETNNDYFTLEKTKDGQNFEHVATIDGAGTSKNRLDYSFTDRNPFSGTSYYRLRQTDYDGKFEIFPLVTVNHIAADEVLSIRKIYPNPFQNQFTLEYSADGDDVQLIMVNSKGEEVYKDDLKTYPGQNEYHFNAGQNLTSDVYLIYLKNGITQTQATRIIKR